MRISGRTLMLLIIAGVLVGAGFVTVLGEFGGASQLVKAEAIAAVTTQVVNKTDQAATAQAAPSPAPERPVAAALDLVSAQEEVLGDIYVAVLPSVVHIQVGQGQGSGFVWDQEGHIVTNNHVVEGASEVVVSFADGEQARPAR